MTRAICGILTYGQGEEMTGYIEVRKGVYEPRNYAAPERKIDTERLREIIRTLLVVAVRENQRTEKLKLYPRTAKKCAD